MKVSSTHTAQGFATGTATEKIRVQQRYRYDGQQVKTFPDDVRMKRRTAVCRIRTARAWPAVLLMNNTSVLMAFVLDRLAQREGSHRALSQKDLPLRKMETRLLTDPPK